MSDDIVEGYEAYDFTWVGKKASILEANKPIRKTLRPCINESLNWNTTKNLYIEGDNLEVLKILRESYLNKVKMIYIDPPYNRGEDFIYKDNYSQTKDEYDESIGAYDEDSNRLVKNTDSNGRFHSDWCSMIYPRLLFARDLLREDGVIFISIDDNEVANLRKICDEVFGEKNFIAQLIWHNKKGGGNDAKFIAIEHEYILMYAKAKNELDKLFTSYSAKYISRYKKEDEIGRFFWDTFKRKSGKQYYPIVCPDGSILQYDSLGNPISWLRSEARFKKDLKSGDIRIIKVGDNWSVQFKQRLPQGKKPRTIFLGNQGTTADGTRPCRQRYDMI